MLAFSLNSFNLSTADLLLLLLTAEEEDEPCTGSVEEEEDDEEDEPCTGSVEDEEDDEEDEDLTRLFGSDAVVGLRFDIIEAKRTRKMRIKPRVVINRPKLTV